MFLKGMKVMLGAQGAVCDQNIPIALHNALTRKKSCAVILATSASFGGNCRKRAISARSGISSLAAGQSCAEALNQGLAGDGEVFFNGTCALLLLAPPRAAHAHESLVTSAHFVPLKKLSNRESASHGPHPET